MVQTNGSAKNNSGAVDRLFQPNTPASSFTSSPLAQRGQNPHRISSHYNAPGPVAVPFNPSYAYQSFAMPQSTYVPPYARADRWRPQSPRSRPHHEEFGRYGSYSSPTRARDWRPDTFYTSDYNSHGRGSSGFKDDPRGRENSHDYRQAEAGRVMPKHFKQPLTCFYWANQGRCNKSDDECWYAHYRTGVVAAAPVKLDDPQNNGSSAAVAGAKAVEVINDHARREENLKSRETALNARESDIATNEHAVEKSAECLKEAISAVFMALETIRNTSGDARKALESRREVVIQTNTLSLDDLHPLFRVESDFNEDQSKSNPDSIASTLSAGVEVVSAIDSVIDAINGLERQVMDVKRHMEIHVGTYHADAKP